DFLDREPDQGGFEYWSDEINRCGADALCGDSRRIGVSAAFFVEQEFQQTGFFVYRLYKASFGSRPNYAQFTMDRSQVLGGPSLEQSRQAFADQWGPASGVPASVSRRDGECGFRQQVVRHSAT